jgi:hypothetical protein
MGQLFASEYLTDYLLMVEETESPRIFHIWSALGAVSMAMGRRCKLPFGHSEIFPNQYVLMIGTPGTRKTTAMNIAQRLLRQSTGVRFAPKDTGFQRQGLIKAMQGNGNENDKKFLESAELAAGPNGSILGSLEDLASIGDPDLLDPSDLINVADKHVLAIMASEFSRVIGQNNMSMMDFLGERYDGDDFEYQTKDQLIELKNTLMSMIGCSTPVSIAHSLPPQAGGQGFLSRIILVYGAKKYKSVPWPKAPDVDVVMRIKDTLSTVYQLCGDFDMTPEGKAYAESLYDYIVDITDARFIYYSDRRFTHLLKLGMVFAATRGELVITKTDFLQAHTILRATEIGMPDALGEFGMNPMGSVKQQILEKLRNADSPVDVDYLMACFHRDATGQQILEVLSELRRANLVQVAGGAKASGKLLFRANVTRQNTEDSMMKTLREMVSK